MNKILLLSLTVASLLPSLMFAQATPGGSAGNATGIEGTISAGPMRGGPVREGESSSAPLANMAFVVQQGDKVITSFETDSQGHFRVLLASGHYTIARKDVKRAIGSYGPWEVDVSPGKMSSVSWHCDTGMR